jgi:drug/metabolite transporter (DMT)-like permease
MLSLDWFSRLATEKWLYFALCGYLGAFITYMTLLKHAPIGPAFAASHMQIVSVLLISVLFLHEKLDIPQIAGSILIIGGVFVLACRQQHPGPT